VKVIKLTFVLLLSLTLSGCGCYETYESAWEACNGKYNGQCHYLGPDFKVCKKSEAGSNHNNDQFNSYSCGNDMPEDYTC